MNKDFVYTVSRFGVSTAEEVLVEHAELICEDEGLVIRIDGSPDRKLITQDAADAIAQETVLNEIRPNQVTRIKASGAAFDELPFLLSVPGDPDDFDEAFWSETQADEHTRQDWVVQPGRRRVAYVNESRWCPWPTDDGPRMLPEAWPVIGLSSTWARMTFCEAASMTSGTDEMTLGLVTPRVVAACCNPDAGYLRVAVWPRNGDSSEDAEIFVRWLLEWLPKSYSSAEGFKALMTQLVVEAQCNGLSGEDLAGSRLAAGWDIRLGFGDTDTSEWNLELKLPGVIASLALDSIEQRGGTLAAIVKAGCMPNSPEGQARRAALRQWDDNRPKLSSASESDDDGNPDYDATAHDDEEYDEPDQYDEDLSAPWNHKPLSRMPAVITPGEIPIQFWFRYGHGQRPVGFDFIFSWNGSREADWNYRLSPDNTEKPNVRINSFHGQAAWPDGVNVQLTYKSNQGELDGQEILNAAAPTLMDPRSDERMKRPGLWVDLARRIIDFLDDLHG